MRLEVPVLNITGAKLFKQKLSGTVMFSYLKKLIKAVCSLPHGDADIEGSVLVHN